MKIEELTEAYLINSLEKLEALCFDETAWSKDLLNSVLTSSFTHIYMLKENNQYIGYLIIQKILDEGEIQRIGIHPDYRRKSLGKLMLSTILKKSEIETCFLEVNERNESAKKLYLSCGFEIIGRRVGYYQDGNDALMMKWKRTL